jgi:GH24 family phage-related lysozyme (muramidase)
VKISERGIGLLKSFEGLELEAYQDIAGIWTIGYGHTGDDVEPGMRISEREAEALLRKDLKPREDAIDRFASVSLNQNEFDALVSFVYNVGAAAFGGSTARKRLNRGDRIGAADALAWWNKATVNGVLREVLGLTRRRAAERALFLEPSNPPIVRDPKKIDENSRITPIEDSPRRGSVGESRTVQGATVAGGAGAAASTLGSDSVEELNQTETNIESGHSLTEHKPTTDSDVTVGIDEDGNPVIGGETDTQTGQMIGTQVERPSKHEVHAVEAQLQFALLVLIILSALFVIYARFDDWRNYRR